VKDPKQTKAEISAKATAKKNVKDNRKLTLQAASMERWHREEAGADAIAEAELNIDKEIDEDEAYLRESLKAAFQGGGGDDDDDNDDNNDSEGEVEAMEEESESENEPEPRKVSDLSHPYTCQTLTWTRRLHRQNLPKHNESGREVPKYSALSKLRRRLERGAGNSFCLMTS
jgi:hypothetical protein